MAWRMCLDCPEVVQSPARRCAQHEAQRQAARDARRGTSAQRGYGPAHRSLRASLAPSVERGEWTCGRCGQRILPGQPWDLGHVGHGEGKGQHAGPEHASCNRAGRVPNSDA